MTPEEILNNSGNQKHEVDLGVALIRILELGCYNKMYLRSILKRQIETQELIKGGIEIEDKVLSRLEYLEKQISDIASQDYYDLVRTVLK
ncbi:MAG: hypothetical protein ACRC6O_02050 [Flavobacterium sp.]